MKRLSYLMASLVIGGAVLASGCAEKKTEVKADVAKPAIAVAEAGNVNYEKAYAPILAAVRKYFSSQHKNGDAYPDEFMGIMDFLYVGSKIDTHPYLGYMIQDISGDNIPELLIGNAPFKVGESEFRQNIFTVYTYANGQAQLIVSGRSRSYYDLLKDGQLLYYGSDGAASSCFGTYKLSFDGTKLDCTDFYFTQSDPNDAATINYYHNTFGKREPQVSEKLAVTYSQYWSIYKNWQEREQVLHLKPVFTESTKANPTSKAVVQKQVQVKLVDIQKNPLNSTAYEYYRQTNTESAEWVMIEHENILKNFRLFRLTNHDIDVNGKLKFIEEQVYSKGMLDKPLAILISFPGSMPPYGFSYQNDMGETIRYYLTQSGEDGQIEITSY